MRLERFRGLDGSKQNSLFLTGPAPDKLIAPEPIAEDRRKIPMKWEERMSWSLKFCVLITSYCIGSQRLGDQSFTLEEILEMMRAFGESIIR